MNPWLNGSARVFLWTSPGTILISGALESSRFAHWVNQKEIVGWAIALLLFAWIGSGLFLFASLLLSPRSRERLLTRLARIQERDEREELLVGRASRASFLFMLSVLLGLGILSTFRYGREIGNESPSGQSLTLGHWSWIERRPPETHTDFQGTATVRTELLDLPISKTGLLGCLILLQLGSFWIFSKRSQTERN